MILQALAELYDAMADREEVCPLNWGYAKVSYALELSDYGEVLSVVPLKYKPEGAKKEIPREIIVPEPVKKTSGTVSNFLCENSSYFLGYDEKGSTDRSLRCFAEAGKLHHRILDGLNNKHARAILSFFDNWNPLETESNLVLQPYLEDIKKGANIVFMLSDGIYAQNVKEIKEAWEENSEQKERDSEKMICLVTGRYESVARLHPNIKGIMDAQSSGASLVSFNEPAFESYGHEGKENGQGRNAPVSKSVAFKYGAALNRLVSDYDHVQRIGDTTVLYWAENADPVYQDLMGLGCFGRENVYTLDDLKSVINQVKDGGRVLLKGDEIEPDNRFYVLGLAPNAARLSVRFFEQNSFGIMLKRLDEHNMRLEIVKPSTEDMSQLPLWSLLNETANQKSKTKRPSSPMAASVLRSILEGAPLPDSLFESLLIRIRAEHSVKWKKAAIIKAYFLSLNNNDNTDVYKEVATVDLNENSTYVPYLLGRMFAVLEKIQKDANPGITTTIKDRYFTSACTTPALIFPVLIRLSQHHQRKLSEGSRRFYDQTIQEIQNKIDCTYPDRMTLQEQGAFYLGYYHQNQRLYTKVNKEEAENE